MEYFYYKYYYYAFLLLNINTIILTADSPTKMYINLARNGIAPKMALTRLKFNNPKSPQFNAPINTNINDSLSILLSLYIITPTLL